MANDELETVVSGFFPSSFRKKVLPWNLQGDSQGGESVDFPV